MTLAPHLMNLFSKEVIEVKLRLGPSSIRTGDRKAVARELYDEVELLHSDGRIDKEETTRRRAVPRNALSRA
jgi:hypothetical protein